MILEHNGDSPPEHHVLFALNDLHRRQGPDIPGEEGIDDPAHALDRVDDALLHQAANRRMHGRDAPQPVPVAIIRVKPSGRFVRKRRGA